jgi:hypothetical protein
MKNPGRPIVSEKLTLNHNNKNTKKNAAGEP